jgi:hypothetical protein
MAKVYLHRRKDNNQPFYVGMTTLTYGRPFDVYRNQRSEQWNEINDKYGRIVEIIVDDISDKKAIQLEIELIAKYGRKDKGLGELVNKTDGGLGGNGVIYTDEEKLARSVRQTGKGNSMYGKSGELCPMYGKHLSKETKNKIREKATGRKHNDETKKKLSEANKGENNSMYGKTHSAEIRNKISEANTGKFVGELNPMYGKTHSAEIRNKIREKATGRKHNDETKKKMSESHMGKILNEDILNNMRKSQQNRKKMDNCSSKYKNVSWHKGTNKWYTSITFDKEKYSAGYFHDEYEAHIAIEKLRNKLKQQL